MTKQVKIYLFFLSAILTLFFTFFSYTVAKERWQSIDFDSTVKLQDNISRRFDSTFSFFSLLGSAEITVGICLVLAFLAIVRKRGLEMIGWLMIIPATVAEVLGKLLIFHPGPPVFFHRSLQLTNLPSFYVHTNFSYPSGHMTRTIFIVTVLMTIIILSTRNLLIKLVMLGGLALLAFLMGVTRVYLGEHWLSDVIGGTLLGAAVGFFASVLILRRPSVAQDQP